MAVLTHPVMAAMERATLGGAALSALARRGGEQLVAVIGPTSAVHGQVRTGARIEEPSTWRDAFAVGTLTKLRALSVIAPADPGLLEPLVASPLAQQLATLDIFCELPPRALVAAQLATLTALPNLERITIRYTDVLRRRPATTHVIVVLERASARRPPYRIRVQTTRCDVELLGSTINAFALELPPGLVLELEYVGTDPSELERFDDLAATIRVMKHFADVLVPER